MSFIDDPTLPFPKFDLNPFAGDPSKAISAGDWNTVCQSLLDLRDAVSGLTGSGPSSPLLFLIRSDSEGVTLTTETDMDDPVDNVTVPNGNVVLTKMYSLNFVEPISPGILGTGPLRIIGFSPAHGPELAIGKALNDLLNGPGSTPTTTSKVWLDQISLSSSKISDWVPSSTSGQLSPLLGGSNLYGNSKNRANAASAISNRSIPCMFVLLGSNDGSDPTSAANAGTNATAFISQHRADLGAGLLVVWAIPQSTLPLGVFPNIATARANLITALTGTPGLAMVFTEDMPVNDDGAHFTASAISVIGTRQAAAYRRLAGIGP
ncbi:MAG TPA: sialate O-acetylesterase, partial [Kofleriaceae bacterium]